MLYCNLREAYNNSGGGSLFDDGINNVINTIPKQPQPVLQQQMQQQSAPGYNSDAADNYASFYGEEPSLNQHHELALHKPQAKPHKQRKVMFVNDTDSSITVPRRKKQKSHPYYIKRFFNSVTDDDLMSLASNYDTDMYQHIMDCKYCRMKIKYEMQRRFINQASEPSNKQITGYTPQSYQMQHFDPNLTLFQQQQMPLQQQQPINTPVQTKVVEQRYRNEAHYEQYLMIFVVVILVLFLFADIIVKIMK